MSRWKIVLSIVSVLATGGLVMAQAEVAFSAPEKGGKFTVFAYDPANVLVFDAAAKAGYILDTAKKTRIGSFTTELKTVAAATWADKELWVLDQDTAKIYQLEPRRGTVIRGIPAPKPEGEGEWSYEGVTWDGEYLWVAYFAGFSSKLNKVDRETGEVVQSFYADAHPRGIYSDGKYLWTLCYNGEKLPSVVDKRALVAKAFDMVKDREFIGKVEVVNPRGLAFDGERFLTLDLDKGEVIRFEPAK